MGLVKELICHFFIKTITKNKNAFEINRQRVILSDKIGVLEYWSAGVIRKGRNYCRTEPNTPTYHYSITPLLILFL